MAEPEPCPRCGSISSPGSPGGLCAHCLYPGVLDDGSAHPTTIGALNTLDLTGGPMPRVLLRDTEDFNGPGPVVRPTSGEMPDDGPRAGHLQLLGEIARGGMGAVLKGRDVDLGRDLAVKVLLEKHAADPDLTRRFVEEAQIAGQLQHPGVVPVYELGTFADRRPYFAMKLVKGRTLAEVMADRPNPSDDHPRLLAIFLDVAQTMAYVHARGVIHRDLKPSNVMVGSFGEVQVMDWGLAKILPRGGMVDDRSAGKVDVHETVIATARSGSGSDLDQTHAGSALGTPSYMSPEQARGENEGLDERTDVFSLGSILCEILTGQPAFAGRNSGEILRIASRGDLSGAWRRLDACGADADLVALARDTLAPEVEDRPRDAGAIVDRLNLHFSGVREKLRAAELARAAESARAEESKRTAEVADARAWAEARARRLTVALAASIVGLLAVGGGGYAWVLGQKAERSARIGRAVDDALADAARLRGEARSTPPGEAARWGEALAAARRADELARQGDADDLMRRRITETMAGIAAERARAEATTEKVRSDRVLLARLETIRGDRSERYGNAQTDSEYAAAFRAAGLDFDKVAPGEAARWIAGRTDPDELVVYLDDWLLQRQSSETSESGWRRLLEAARAADRDEWRNSLRVLIGTPPGEMGVALRRLADDLDAQEDQPAASLVLLALLLREGRFDVDRAAETLRRAASRHPGDFWVHFNLARVFSRLAGMRNRGLVGDVYPNPEESLRHLTAAVAIRPKSALVHNNIGLCLQALGKWEEAVFEHREAIRLLPSFPMAYNDLAMALKAQGKPEEALAVYRELREKNPDNVEGMRNLITALRSQGRMDEANAATTEAFASLRKAIRLKPNDAQAHIDLAGTLNWASNFDEAIAEYREAIRLKPGSALIHYRLGVALTARNKADEAIAEFREALRLEPKDVYSHVRLGGALEQQGKMEEAIAEYREATRLQPNNATAHSNLGDALSIQGNLEEALDEYRSARKLVRPVGPDAQELDLKLQSVERMLTLDRRLPAILKRDEVPRDAAEGADFARLCGVRHRHADAARLYADAFALDPRLADDLQAGHRYNAVRSAALAGCGKGRDDPATDEAARARLRARARDWLRADLGLRSKQLESGKATDRAEVARILRYWRADANLAGIRDADALAGLPEAEREDCQKLWAEVDATLARANAGPSKP